MGGSPDKVKAPKADYAADIQKFVSAYGSALPQVLGFEQQFRPQFQGLNLQDISGFLGGAGGEKGLFELGRMASQEAGQQLGAARKGELGQMAGQTGLTRTLIESLSPEQAAQVRNMQSLAEQAAGAESGYASRMGEAFGTYGVRPQEFGTTITGSNLRPTATQRGLLGETITQGGLLGPTIQAAEQDTEMANQMAQEAYGRRGTLSAQEQRSTQQTAREAAQSAGRLGGNAAIAAEIQNREAALAGRRAEATQAGQQAFEQRQNLANLRFAEQQGLFGQQAQARQIRTGEEQAAFGQRIGSREQALQQEQALFGQQSARAQQRLAEQQGFFGQQIGGAQATAGMQQAGLSQLQDIERMRMGMRGAAGEEAARAYGAAQGFYTQPGLALLSQQPLSYQSGQQMLGMGMGQIGRGTPGLINPDTGLNLGAAERQNQLQAQAANAQAQASYSSGLFGGIGSAIGGLAGGIGAAGGMSGFAAAAPLMLSDRRLKTDIEKVGKTNAGLPIYTYKYKGDNKTQMGVMAQDVEKKTPKAVKEVGGFKAVNYALVK